MNDINVVLAEQTGTGAIRLCGCHCIHMSIGPVTIKLAPEMFAQTALMVKQAMECLSVIIAVGETEEAEKPN